jgi:hypothetical protein
LSIATNWSQPPRTSRPSSSRRACGRSSRRRSRECATMAQWRR